MPDFFAHRFAHTNFAGPIHTLVQIGVQTMQDVEDALRVDPRQMVLTTLDPDLAQKADSALGAWRSADRTARVEHAAITPKRPAQAMLPVAMFEQPSLSSRKKPTGLHTLFPDLAATRQVEVPTIALSAFLSALPDRPAGARHMLRLGLTGEEHTLLTAAGGKLLQGFHDIIISLPDTALFERALSRDALLERLHSLGFMPVAQREGPLRAVPECHLIRSPHHAELQSCQAVAQDGQGAQAEQKTLIQTLTREKDALRKALDDITLEDRDLAELRTRYAALLADYEAQSETLRQVQARVKAALARFQT
ncbi:MAG: hypothetical protein AAFQ55_11855 [Pseudomonadota bacterium]